MNRKNVLIAVLTLGLAILAPALALADEPVSENRTINASVTKVFLDGIASLQLRQGATPSLVVYATKDNLGQLSTVQTGDVLHIETEGSFFLHVPRVRVELTLPNLSQFSSNGIGPVQLTGFSGDDLQLNVNGTGDVTVTTHYKHVVVRSSGVASMTLNDGDSESIDLSLPGAGHVNLIGQTKVFTSRLDGVGSVDAKELKADSVTSYLNGVGSVKVYAKQSANMYLRGVGSATVFGNPANRNASISGFGKVTWE